MKSFDEWFVEFGMERNNFSSADEKHWFKHNVKAGWKAGAQSRQSESNPMLMQKRPKVTLCLCRRNATALNT